MDSGSSEDEPQSTKSKSEGEGYTNYKGNIVPAKSSPDELMCKCPRKCSLSIDNDTKSQIWTYFYSLDTKNQQDLYLQTLIEAKEIKCRVKNVTDCSAGTSENQSSQTKNKSFEYNVKVNGVFTAVCKNGVSPDRVARLTSLLVQNKTPIDMRGKNRSGNAIEGNICVIIHDHISRFDVRETHYGTKKKKYLDAKPNITKMYEMFQIDHPELKDKVKYSFYYRYFKENFNLSFGRPQVDVCSQCENFRAKLRDPCLSDNVKCSVIAEQIVHQRRAKKFYTKQKEIS